MLYIYHFDGILGSGADTDWYHHPSGHQQELKTLSPLRLLGTLIPKAPMSSDYARSFPRFDFVVDIELTDTKTGQRIEAKTRDLSLHGCGVNTETPFSKGTDVELRLVYAGAVIQPTARVVYSNPGLNMGLLFMKVSTHDQQVLKLWIEELC